MTTLRLPRRFRTRVALIAFACAALAAVAARYAFAASHAPPIGTGVVVIDTKLGYQGGAAAGTGMVLTSSGEILTNNHVIRGATTIKVVVPGTGHTYAAKVVGYDVKDDVAVLKATNASNLETIPLGTSTGLRLGQTVTAVGNAGGTGTLVSSTGTITGIARTIAVDDESGGTVALAHLLETNAGLQAGDSGGPLLNAAGRVVGMDTAANLSSGYQNVASSDGYAIPINRALAIEKLIVAGKSSAAVHVGATAFLGIAAVAAGQYGYAEDGAVVAQVVQGSPAAKAGLVVGDVITAIDGKSVGSPAAIGAMVLARKPGATVTVTFVDGTGTTSSVRVRLGSGAPQ